MRTIPCKGLWLLLPWLRRRATPTRRSTTLTGSPYSNTKFTLRFFPRFVRDVFFFLVFPYESCVYVVDATERGRRLKLRAYKGIRGI